MEKEKKAGRIAEMDRKVSCVSEKKQKRETTSPLKNTKRNSLLYFVKFPEPGKVKTRLAETIGNERAASVYRMLAERTLLALRQFSEDGIGVVVTYDPPGKRAEIKC